MTVKEIFDLRKQGKIEEAYDAIRLMYAAHKGRYTTLCMFWTARDVFNLRLHKGRTDEAAKILAALKRLQPNLEDTDGNVAKFMQSAEHRLAATVSAGSPALLCSAILSLRDYPPARNLIEHRGKKKENRRVLHNIINSITNNYNDIDV